MIKFKAEIIVDFCQGTFLEDEDCFRKMDASNIIFISGVVVACIWLGASILCDGKARTYVNLFGVLIDVILSPWMRAALRNVFSAREVSGRIHERCFMPHKSP